MRSFLGGFKSIIFYQQPFDLTWNAGCYVQRDIINGTLTISQKIFVEKIVEKFDITRSSKTPASTSLKLGCFLEEDPGSNERFREVVGVLI